MRRALGVILITTMIPMLFFVTSSHASPEEYLIWYREQYNETGTSLMIVWLYKMVEAEPSYDFYIVKARIIGMASAGLHYVRADIWSNGVCNDWEPKNGIYVLPASLSITVGGVGFGINIPAETVGTTGGLMPTFGWQTRSILDSPDKEFISTWYVPDGVDFAFLVAGSEWFDPVDPLIPPFCTDAIHVYYPYQFYFRKLTIVTTLGGTTSPIPGEYQYYPGGFYASVWARPYLGYYFTYWFLNGAYYYSSPIKVLMTADYALTAYYQSSGGGGGGCPYVSVWNGTRYVPDNNLLPASESSNGTDVEDYYKLEQPLALKDGKYSLLISEFENEHSYLDQVRLLAVDHESDVSIAVTSDGEILTYKHPATPISCVDNNGTDRLNQIRLMDGNVSEPATYFEGFPGDYLVLNFGPISSDNAKLILRDDMKCMTDCIEVQAKDQGGNWQTVTTLTSRNFWAIEAVNLSPYVVHGQDFMVRLYWKYHHRLDYVGLDTTKQEDYELHTANLASAKHSAQGDVKALITEGDNLYAELIPGQHIRLEFTLPQNTKQARTYILYTEGHYTNLEG